MKDGCFDINGFFALQKKLKMKRFIKVGSTTLDRLLARR